MATRAFKPTQHPRDRFGRFTSSGSTQLSRVERGRATRIAETFNPQQNGDPRTYLGGIAPVGKTRAVDVLGGRFADINKALRAGKQPPEAADIDAAMVDLPDDVVLSRRVPLDVFGPVGPESLTGMKVRDAGMSAAQLGAVRANGDVRMVIAAPAGTKALISPDTGEVILAPDTELAVSRVTKNDAGGFDMHLVVLPRSETPERKRQPTPQATPATPPSEPARSAPAVPEVGTAEATRDLNRLIDNGSGDQPLLSASFGEIMGGSYGALSVNVDSAERHVGFGKNRDRPGVYIKASIRGDGDVEAGRVERVFYRDENDDLVAVHSILTLDPQFRGQRFATNLNGRLEQWYREQGVTRIELHANIDVGGYTWASAGYNWSHWRSASKVLARLREKRDEMAAERAALDNGARSQSLTAQIAAADEILARAEAREFGNPAYPTAYEISQIGRGTVGAGERNWLGKDAMLDSSWHGVKWL